jgi:hypothetical protein
MPPKKYIELLSTTIGLDLSVFFGLNYTMLRLSIAWIFYMTRNIMIPM